jgi:hypothetical protein
VTEANFFVPDVPIRGEGRYWATGLSGEAVEVKTTTPPKEYLALLEVTR